MPDVLILLRAMLLLKMSGNDIHSVHLHAVVTSIKAAVGESVVTCP